MGSGNFSQQAYQNLRTVKSYDTASKSQTFSSRSAADVKKNLMSPYGIKFREARDSADNPESLGIMVLFDETGSMGDIPHILVTQKLGILMQTILDHGVKSPAVFFGAVGDHISDKAPLQIGQFESDTKLLDEWLTKIFLEHNGGGNNGESYSLAHIFAGKHTSIDCFEKRNVKGFLFTIGDENPHMLIEAAAQREIFGYPEAQDITAEEALAMAQRQYHVFHIHIDHGSSIDNRWSKLLGERLLIVDSPDAVAEVIASTIAVMNGADLKAVTANFSPQIASTVQNALVHVNNSLTKTSGGVATL